MDEFFKVAEEQGWSYDYQVVVLIRFLCQLDDAFNGTVSEELALFAREQQAKDKGSE